MELEKSFIQILSCFPGQISRGIRSHGQCCKPSCTSQRSPDFWARPRGKSEQPCTRAHPYPAACSRSSQGLHPKSGHWHLEIRGMRGWAWAYPCQYRQTKDGTRKFVECQAFLPLISAREWCLPVTRRQWFHEEERSHFDFRPSGRGQLCCQESSSSRFLGLWGIPACERTAGKDVLRF